MSRLQLALNVSDLDGAVRFYTSLFGVGPAKVRPGYANFAVVDPPLKLVLIETADTRGTGLTGALNHVGVEVDSTAEVLEAATRLGGEGLATSEEETTCCYAVQDKVWVADPDWCPGRSTPCWGTPRGGRPVRGRHEHVLPAPRNDRAPDRS